MKETKNIAKYNAYKQVFKLMKAAKSEKNLPYSIALIALTESVIADRTQSYISFKESNWYELNKKKHIGTAILIDKCNKYFKQHHVRIKRKDSSILETNDLFQEIKIWLKDRNTILHSFAKTNQGTNTMGVDGFIKYAIQTSEDGLRLIALLKKWFDQQKQNSNKN